MRKAANYLLIVIISFSLHVSTAYGAEQDWTEWQQLKDNAYNGLYFSYKTDCVPGSAVSCNLWWGFKNGYTKEVDIQYTIVYLASDDSKTTINASARLKPGVNELPEFKTVGRKLLSVAAEILVNGTLRAKIDAEKAAKKAEEERQRREAERLAAEAAEEKRKQMAAEQEYWRTHPEEYQAELRRQREAWEEAERRDEARRREIAEQNRRDDERREREARRQEREQERERIAQEEREERRTQMIQNAIQDVGNHAVQTAQNYANTTRALNEMVERNRQEQIEDERRQREAARLDREARENREREAQEERARNERLERERQEAERKERERKQAEELAKLAMLKAEADKRLEEQRQIEEARRNHKGLGPCNPGLHQSNFSKGNGEVSLVACAEKTKYLGEEQGVRWGITNNTEKHLSVQFQKMYIFSCGQGVTREQYVDARIELKPFQTIDGGYFSGDLDLGDPLFPAKVCGTKDASLYQVGVQNYTSSAIR